MALNLYDYQLKAMNMLETGSILCGGVGSGKSRVALAYYFLKVGLGNLCINGKGKYTKMTNPVKLYIITTARKRDTLEWQKEFVPFLLNENDICIDSWNNIKKYIDVKNSFFIFDEQRVIGSGTWVKSFLKIVKNNRWILLTATPGDTWLDYIPVFIANGFYKNRTEFLRNHVVFNSFTRYPKVERYVEEQKLIRLKNDILVNMDYKRATQSHHKHIIVSYDKEKFKTALHDRWDMYKNKPVQDAGQLCYLLRKIVNSDISRVDKLKKIIARHNKIIIFYNFNYELDILKQVGKDLKIRTAEWNGHKHELIPCTKKWIYLVQYAAGAEGWNCIETNIMIFYSQNYSYKAMIQAAGRIDRLNTPYDHLYYYHLYSDSLIDKAILKALKNKKNFNETRFVGNFNSRQKHAL